MDKISQAMCVADMSKAHVGRDLYYLDKVERITRGDVVWYAGTRLGLGLPRPWFCDPANDDDDQDDDEGCVQRGTPYDVRGSVVYRNYWTGTTTRRVAFAPCARPPRSPSTCLTRRPAASLHRPPTSGY